MANPWYSYKRFAAMCRCADLAVKNRQAYRAMREHGLLQKRRFREPELYQATKLFELLPQGPNDLRQVDVTYNPYSPALVAAKWNCIQRYSFDPRSTVLSDLYHPTRRGQRLTLSSRLQRWQTAVACLPTVSSQRP